jgi:hypothetical protein
MVPESNTETNSSGLAQQPINRIADPSAFLCDSGLLFKINKEVMHPLGLALAVVVDTINNDRFVKIEIWDCRDDPDGMLFGSDLYKMGFAKLEKYMNDHGYSALDSRAERLGFVVQTEPEPRKVKDPP